MIGDLEDDHPRKNRNYSVNKMIRPQMEGGGQGSVGGGFRHGSTKGNLHKGYPKHM